MDPERRAKIEVMAPVMSIRPAARIAGVSTSWLQQLLAEASTNADGSIQVSMKMGLDGKVRPSRRFDVTGRDEAILSARAAGGSIRAIAAEVGCSVGTVHRVIAARSTVSRQHS